jgi:NADPH:quinone reductase-like Zn-dependent oxidoreductase
MKAFVNDRYGSPDVMEIRDLPKPQLTDEGALVRIRATSINAYDWHMLRGKPYLARLSEGLRRPKTTVLGVDVAGEVEAVGANVTHLEVGDRVFGSRSGAFAEYVSGRNMVRMPANLSFEQAAAVPTAGMTALQGLRDQGNLQPGQRVLVNGAGGGVGTFAVQIAKALGAEVTATTGRRNLELMRSIGADDVIDYAREDFTRGTARYDLVLDIGGRPSLRAIRRTLTPTGRVVMVAPGGGQWIGPIVRLVGGVVLSRLSGSHLRAFLATVNRDDLLTLKDLIEAGKVTPVIDRTIGFDQIPAGVRHVESGQAAGKVVVTVP